MESNDSESEIKQIMMKQARRTILLVDHSKFDKTAFVRCSGFDTISYIVTDLAPTADWQEFLSDRQVKLID